MSKTTDNLSAAFAGESQANRKYLAFAKKAAQDGFPEVAKLFKAAAEAETVHAHAHLRAMDGVQGTAENLAEAAAGEKYEFEEMYPPMLATAQAEGDRRAALSMNYAQEVEKVHYGLFNQALDAVKSGTDLPEAAVRGCPVCGHTVIGDAPHECPVCKAKGDKFMLID